MDNDARFRVAVYDPGRILDGADRKEVGACFAASDWRMLSESAAGILACEVLLLLVAGGVERSTPISSSVLADQSFIAPAIGGLAQRAGHHLDKDKKQNEEERYRGKMGSN